MTGLEAAFFWKVMPPLAPRHFTVGDHVRLVRGAYSVNNPQDVYTISRMLPVQEDVCQYRVKWVSDGQGTGSQRVAGCEGDDFSSSGASGYLNRADVP